MYTGYSDNSENSMKHIKKIEIRRMSDGRAKKEVADFFVRKLSKGVTRVDVLDVSASLKLPGTQVEKVFREFIREGRVKQL